MFSTAPTFAYQIQVCFSPPLPGGCDPTATVVQAIEGARKTVLVQMYALTSRQIVSALVSAKSRGVDVRAIVDRSQLREDRSDTYAVGRLASGGVPVLVDTVPGLMHNKVMIVDDATVVTGSFNYTWSAEHKNAENLLVIYDPALAAEYTQNWTTRATRSRPLNASASGESTTPQQSAASTSAGVPKGAVRQQPQHDLPMAGMSLLRRDFRKQSRGISERTGGRSGWISARKELSMTVRERSLRDRCARFGAIISRIGSHALTERQTPGGRVQDHGDELADYRKAARAQR